MTELDEMRSFFDRLAPNWDDNTHHDTSKIQAILTAAAPTPGGRFLDVACGTGVLFPHLLAYGPTLLRAIDLSPEMIRIAREKWSDPRIQADTADFYSFGETGFDLVTVYSAYPHFTDRNRFARAAHACLSPGGRLLIAHSESRAAINSHHKSGDAEQLSATLKGLQEEAASLLPYFQLDLLADTPAVYLLSGTAR